MAKKKKDENSLQYLQMPLPSGRKYSKMTKVSFGGLNKRHNIDSGDLSMESNISTNEYPYLTPSNQKVSYLSNLSNYETPISMSAFDDFIVVVYIKDGKVLLDYITSKKKVYTGILQYEGTDTTNYYVPRSIVQFNVYDTPTDPLTGQFVKKLLIFPDKASMYMNIVEAETSPLLWKTLDNLVDETDENKERLALETKDLSVMYVYAGKFYTVALQPKEDGDEGYDENKVTYKRVLVKKSEHTTYDDDGNKNTVNSGAGRFFCDGMDVLVKEYKNDVEPYLPPDTASHNYYYRNLSTNAKDADTLYGSAIYRWVDDESDKENSGWKISIPPTMPDIKYATVHLSRVFGVDDDRVYASGYNDYTNWNLDTVGEYNESNSWCSPSQANTKAGGKFTGITTFDSHIICFKRDFMHEIYNTKNPFRLQDIYAEGCIDNRTIQDVDGKLIFVSEDDVKIYTGSNPRIIGYNLNMSQFTYAVSGTDNRNYYLYCEDDFDKKYLYVYDTFTELWSEQSVAHRVISFAHNKNGMYMLCKDGCVYKMDTGLYKHSWSFETELITNKTVNIKHIKKLQMLVDIPEKVNGSDNLTDEGNPANMKVYILYDDEAFDDMESEEKAKRLVYTSSKYGRLPIRVKPRKTANYGFKLHFEGEGYAKLYELEIFVESGGDLYV